MAENKFADLHCHPSFKNFNRSRIEKNFRSDTNTYNLWTSGTWNDSKVKRAEQNGVGISTYEQSALLDCYRDRQGKGEVTSKLLFASLYPLERGWVLGNSDSGIDMAEISEYTNRHEYDWFKKIKDVIIKKIIGNLNGKDSEEFRSVLQGLYIGLPREIIYFMQGNSDFSHVSPKKWLKDNLQPPYDYFIDLINEYKFLQRKNNVPVNIKGRNLSYNTILTKNDLTENENNPLQTGVVLTIEGAHVFSMKFDGKDLVRRSMDEMYSNIKIIKDWGTFFITMCHHFDNGLCGHAHSHPVPLNYIVNQKKSMNAGFLTADGKEIDNTDLNETDGEKIIKQLLSINKDGNRDKNNHRVLIDVKHMSPKSRQRFYSLVKNFNSNNPAEDNIPIIASHVAYSGVRTLKEQMDYAPTGDFTRENAGSTINFQSYVNPSGPLASYYKWGINLCDEDIRNIVESNGLIGITFDQRILGYEGNKTINKPLFWAQVILNTMMAFADAWMKESKQADPSRLWNCLCIGTDFDGIIDPINDFGANFEFPEFKVELNNALRLMPQNQLDYFKIVLPQPGETHEIIEKFCYNNAINFLKNNLNS